MPTRAFRIAQNGKLEATDPTVLQGELSRSPASLHDQGPLWVDLTDPSSEELRAWLRVFEVSPLVEELATGPFPIDALGEQASAVVMSDDGAFFFFPLYGGGGPAAPSRVTGLCSLGRLLTFHAADLPAFVAAQQLASQSGLLPQGSSAGVVAALLRFSGNRSVETANALRRLLREAPGRLIAGEDGMDLAEILGLADRLETLSATVDEQLVTARALSVGRGEAFDVGPLTAHLAATVSNLETLARNIERMDRHVESLRAQYDSRLAERTNRRLAALTVISAVFMPPTLIAGIYGMNFEYVPELTMRWAYPATLGAMIAIAVMMIAYFWRHGWFD